MKKVTGTVKDLRCILVLCVFVFGIIVIIGSGGGGGGSDSSNPEPLESRQNFAIESEAVGATYNISVGLPPTYDESGSPHAAIFLLDGDWFFDDFYDSYDEDDDFILIGINNTDRRNTDYMPQNTCDSGGGGNVAFLDFLKTELVPYLDKRFNIDPSLRLLFGFSHGGSFVFYALFTDHGETFPLLFSIDASLQCWGVSALVESYASANDSLPVIFYSSGASEANADAVRPIMENIIQKDFKDLIVKYDEIEGTHEGIINSSFRIGFDWIGSQISETSN